MNQKFVVQGRLTTWNLHIFEYGGEWHTRWSVVSKDRGDSRLKSFANLQGTKESAMANYELYRARALKMQLEEDGARPLSVFEA